MTWSPRPATSSRCTPRSTGCRPTCVVKVPDGVAPGARRVRDRGGDRDAGRAPGGAAARRAGRGHRARPGRPARGPAAGRGRRPGGRRRHRRGPLPDGGEGRGARVRRTRRRRRRPRRAGAAAPPPAGSAPTTCCSPPAAAPTVPSSSRPGWPGTGPGRRHRQDQARPAVERLLREGARRPVLAVLRPRPLRRPLRARGRRLPRGLRALDRAAQPRLLPRPDRGRRDRRRARWSPRSVRSRTPRRRTSELRTGALEGVGFLLEYPRHGGLPRAARTGGGARARRSSPCAGTAPGRDQPARRVRIGFIGAGNYATSMLLPHLAADPDRRRWPRSRPPGRCRRSTPSASSASRTMTTDVDAVLADPDLDAVFVVTRHASHADFVCRALRDRQGGVRREAAGARPRSQLQRGGRDDRRHRQRPADGRLQPPLRAAVRRPAVAVRRRSTRRSALATWSTPAGSTRAAGTSTRSSRARASSARAGTSSTRSPRSSATTRSRCTPSRRRAGATCT